MNAAEPLLTALANGSAQRRSLRARLGLALAALMLTCSVVLALTLASYARSAFVDVAAENVDTLARQMARELSFGMDRFVREIELQAQHPVFADPHATNAQLRGALEGIQRVYPEFAHISVVDIASAKVIAATGGIFEGGDATGRPVFVEGQRRLFVADVHDAVRLADLLPKPSSGEPLRFLDAAAPIRNAEGRPVRVLGSHLSWEWTRSLKERVLQPVEATRHVEMMLVDTAGKVVLSPSASVPTGTPFYALAGSSKAPAQAHWRDGREYLATEVPTFSAGAFPGLGWRVVVRQPMEVVLATSHRVRDLFILGGAVLGLVAAGLGWLLAGWLIRPVAELARDAALLVPGRNLAASAPSRMELAEVATVRDAFHRVTGEALSRAERLLTELNTIYQGAPVGLAVIDDAMGYARVNEVWSEAFGLGDTHGLGQGLVQTGAPEQLVAAVRQTLGRGLPDGLELTTAGATGTQFWRVVVAPLRGDTGRAVGVSVVATDITDIRRAERELRAADQRKNEFVAMLAHELRNPLAPIGSALDVLDRNPTEEQSRRMRETMRKQFRRIVRLVDDLLDISRVNLGKVTIRLEPVDAREFCEVAVDTVRHLIEAKGQHLTVRYEDGLPLVHGDRVRLEQVVSNLLSNASKYGRDGGWIGLTVSRTETEMLLLVEDDGTGIDAEFLPHVFDLFAQGERSIDRPDAGLGIGLTLVKTLVQLHGGEVEVHSAGRGKGACFTVRLPIMWASVVQSEPESEA